VAGASLPILLALTGKSLIRRAQDGRFALHDLLRQFAGEKLDSDPEARAAVQRRFAAYYGDRLARLEPDLKGPAQIAALDAIEAEIDHVRLAWMLAIGHRYDPARRRLLNGLVCFYTMRARLQESVEMLGGTLDYLHRQSLTPDERDLTALIEVFQGLNLLRLSRNQQASALYQTAMPVVRQMDSPDAGYFFAALSTIALWGNGDPQTGAEWARRALALAQTADDPWGVALALRVLGETIHDSAHYPEARRLFGQALEASRAAGDRWGECEALNLLGRVPTRQAIIPKPIASTARRWPSTSSLATPTRPPGRAATSAAWRAPWASTRRRGGRSRKSRPSGGRWATRAWKPRWSSPWARPRC
jgi:tetratricopeptide (TPR) repeat protein